MKNSISAVIITKNEEKNITRCLENLQWVDEAIVVDDYSADKTKEYAAKYKNVKFHENKFMDFASQRNFAASCAGSDWILSVDADEIITPELKEEVLNAIKKNGFDGYNIPTKNFFWGKLVKHGGWYPNYHVRLFKKSKAQWRGITDERIAIAGDIGKLKNPILHFGQNSREESFKKIIVYSEQKAREEHKNGMRFSFLKLIFSPLAVFLKMYFLRLGFLDGATGFGVARLMAVYQALICLKLRKLEIQGRKLND